MAGNYFWHTCTVYLLWIWAVIHVGLYNIVVYFYSSCFICHNSRQLPLVLVLSSLSSCSTQNFIIFLSVKVIYFQLNFSSVFLIIIFVLFHVGVFACTQHHSTSMLCCHKTRMLNCVFAFLPIGTTNSTDGTTAAMPLKRKVEMNYFKDHGPMQATGPNALLVYL